MSKTTQFEVSSVSISDAPAITYYFHGDTVRAECGDARLYAECDRDDRIDLRITSRDGEVLAKLVLEPRAHRTTTENIMDIGSALLWSHWRYGQASQRLDVAPPSAPPR